MIMICSCFHDLRLVDVSHCMLNRNESSSISFVFQRALYMTSASNLKLAVDIQSIEHAQNAAVMHCALTRKAIGAPLIGKGVPRVDDEKGNPVALIIKTCFLEWTHDDWEEVKPDGSKKKRHQTINQHLILFKDETLLSKARHELKPNRASTEAALPHTPDTRLLRTRACSVL